MDVKPKYAPWVFGVGRIATAVVVAAAILMTGGVAARAAESAGEGEGSAFGKYLAGRFARSMRDAAAASRYYEQIIDEDAGGEDIVESAFLLMLADGRVGDAIDLAKRLLATNPRASLPNQVMAAERIGAGDLDGAVAFIRKAARSRMNALIVPLAEAWALAGSGKGEEGLRTLDLLKEKKGYALFHSFHAALLNDFLGDSDAAEKAFRETVDGQDGGSLRVVEAFGNFLERSGRSEEAVDLYRGFLEREPGNILIEEALARAGSKAIPERFVASAMAGTAEVYYGIAGGLLQENARDTALVYARLAAYLDPERPVVLTLLAGILEGDGQVDAANALYQRLDPKTPYGWNARLRIASNLDAADKVDDAVKLLRTLVKERPGRLEALVALGDLFRARERYDDAGKAYTDAIGRVEKPAEQHWSLFYSRGIAYERASAWSRAEKDFSRALELRPDQPLVLNYLGYSWIDRGENLEVARAMVEKAVELRPTDGYIVDSLGWALYRLKDYDGAVRQLERAVSLRPEDPVINDHLGDALWRVGRRLEARFQWQRALALKPDAEAVPAIGKKLAEGLDDPAPAKAPETSPGR